MRMSWLVLAVWLACGGAGASWQKGHAAAPPVQQPYEVVLDRPKPPTPTDPVDVAARPDLAKVARWWGFVGSFELGEGGDRKVVALYYSDSDENGYGPWFYPNHFSLHAATQDHRGRWASQQVYFCTRCRFGRILEPDAASITVQVQPMRASYLDPKWSPAELERWDRTAEKANAPFTVTISIRDGRPVASAFDSR